MDPVQKIINQAKKTISRYQMVNPGDLVVVAVSGGPDSVCLLDLLNTLANGFKFRLCVAHYNHGLRDKEDPLETELVQNLAESMKHPFFTEQASLLKMGVGSIEEKARDARYQFLEKVRQLCHGHKIAVGHHLNDQAETVLMRLLRGSGISGLSGIPPIRENIIIRPLIEVKRDDIEAYLKARELPYVFDSSNLNTRFLRNKIRASLLPNLLEYQPLFIEHLAQLSKILKEDDLYLTSEAEQWIEKQVKQKSDGDLSIPLPSLAKLPQAIKSRAIRILLKKIGSGLRNIDYGHIQSISRLAESKKSQAMLDLPNGLVVQRIYDTLLFCAGEHADLKAFCSELTGPESFHIEQVNQTITFQEVQGNVLPKNESSQWTTFFDADKVRFPLFVRNFRPGDRFIPLGMKGHKKIKDFFIDLKVPSSTRASTLLLTSKKEVLWICGYRIDERYKVTPQTKRMLKVTIS